MLRLYHYPLSPFCRKLRLMLAEKRINVELIEEKYWEQRPDFLVLNPSGKVPVLRGDDLILFDSQAICEYVEAVHPNPPLFPSSAEQQYEMRRIIFWFDGKFYDEVTSKLLNERLLGKIQRSAPPDGEILAKALKDIKFHLDYIDFLLLERRWVAGDQMTLADFAAAAHISCLDYINDIDWNRSEAIKNWYSALKSRPAFRSLLADHVTGHRVPAHYWNLDF